MTRGYYMPEEIIGELLLSSIPAKRSIALVKPCKTQTDRELGAYAFAAWAFRVYGVYGFRVQRWESTVLSFCGRRDLYARSIGPGL